MFAPLTVAQRATSRARESASRTRASIQEAWEEGREVAETLVRDVEEHDGDETPEEAREELEDEYRPLMEGEESGRGRPSHGRSASYESALTGRSGVAEETVEKKARALEVAIAYGCFFILGACILLAWNAEIVAGAYFLARLQGSTWETSYSSWVALTFTTGNLLFLAHANATQQGAHLGRRISWSITTIIVTVSLYIISTRIKVINPDLFFSTLILCTIILAASASYLQNAVVALSASFGPTFLQAILSGQGAISVGVAGIQLVAAYTSLKSEPSFSNSLPWSQIPLSLLRRAPAFAEAPEPADGVRNSAFTFFLTIGSFAVFSLLAYALLLRLPLYKLVVRSNEGEDSSKSSNSGSPQASLRVVERKIRKLGISMFGVFAITLSVFPAVTSSILSVHEEGSGGPTWSQAAVFLPIGFMVFALGDWTGRILPQAKFLTFTDWRALAVASAARVVFIPLFLMCNTSASSGDPYISSDVVYLVIMFLFSLSNGYVSTLVMLAAVVEPTLEEQEVDIAATCMAFYLTSGLAVGSFISFPVRAAICHCNPFL